MSGFMSFAELLVAVVLLAGVAGAGRWAYLAWVEQHDLTLDVHRARALTNEHRRVAKAADGVADTVQATTDTVVVGTGVVQATHQAIAAIPFEVLAAIPATRGTSRIVRGIHDEIVGGVYRTIQGTSRSIGDVFGRVRPQQSAPVEQPTQEPAED